MQDISLEKLSLIGYDKINQSDEKEKRYTFFLMITVLKAFIKIPMIKLNG